MITGHSMSQNENLNQARDPHDQDHLRWSPACTTESIVTSLINYLSWELHVSTTMPSMPAKKTKLKTKFLKTGTMGPLRMTSALGQYSIPTDQYLGLMPNKSNGLATPQALLAVNQTWDI